MTLAPIRVGDLLSQLHHHGRQHGHSGEDGDFIGRYSRCTVVPMYNASGGYVAKGAPVTASTANPSAFTTSTTQDGAVIGVALEGIAATTFGLIGIAGVVDWVVTAAGQTLGQYLRQSTTAGVAAGTASPTDGTFGYALTSRDATLGTCQAVIFPHPFLVVGGAAVTVLDSTFTIQDNLDTTKQGQFQLSGLTTGVTRTLTWPDLSDTLVTLTATQTLTNKTLTSPVISTIVNTGTLTLPTSTDTLVGRATTDTLTNKTLSSPTLSGTVAGTPVWASNQAITLSTAAQPNVTSLGTLTSLTIAGFTDITIGGLRVKGQASGPAADATNTSTQAILAAGSNSGALDTTLEWLFYRTTTLTGRIGFYSAATLGSIAGIAGASADLAIDVGGTFRAFFRNSDAGRLVLGGGARLGGSLQMVAAIYPATDAAAAQTAAAIYAGSGVPANANGANGDFYLRSDGAAGSNNTVYHKEAGAWVGLTA